MIDPSANDPLLRALAYLHPVWMLVGIALAVVALRTGLVMRRARRGGDPVRRALRERHLRRAKLALIWIAPGVIAGPVSMAWLRGRDPFASAHGYAALLAVALFVATAALGRRLERGDAAPREVHGVLATLAVLASGLAAATGFVLLP